MKIYFVGKTERLFEPTYDYNFDYEIKTDYDTALRLYREWQQEAKDKIKEYTFNNDIEESDFDNPNVEDKTFDITDTINSINVWIVKEIV